MFQDNLSGIASLLQGLHDSQGASPNADPTPVPSSGGPAVPSPLAALLHSAASPEPEAPAAPPQHHGMFGLHGTLRDIIGGLGDAFLVQGGNKPGYSIQRSQERQGDAMQGFTKNPMAAIERLSQENPELAAKMYDQLEQNSRLRQISDEKMKTAATDRVYRMLAAATKDNYPQIKAQMLKYAADHQIELPISLPDTYDADAIEGARRAAVPVPNQLTDENTVDWHRTQDVNTDNRLRAMEAWRKEVIGERTNYHQGVLGLGGRRLDETVTNHRNTEQENAGHHRKTEAQGDRGLDQYDSGTRGNTRRPRPTSIQHKVNPDGTVTIRRLVNGKWIEG